MSHQCSCGRDLNNNYVSYTSAYTNGGSNNNNNNNTNNNNHHHHLDRETSGTLNAKNNNKIGSTSATSAAKLIVGPVGMSVGMGMGMGVGVGVGVGMGVGVGVTSLKDLRDKDLNRSVMARAGDRRN